MSLLNSFEAEAADNAHDSMYKLQARTITSMFAGDDDNQWLDQVEEEFGSDLSDHDEDNGNGNGTKTTFLIDKDAKESLAKEMKEKDPGSSRKKTLRHSWNNQPMEKIPPRGIWTQGS